MCSCRKSNEIIPGYSRLIEATADPSSAVWAKRTSSIYYMTDFYVPEWRQCTSSSMAKKQLINTSGTACLCQLLCTLRIIAVICRLHRTWQVHGRGFCGLFWCSHVRCCVIFCGVGNKTISYTCHLLRCGSLCTVAILMLEALYLHHSTSSSHSKLCIWLI